MTGLGIGHAPCHHGEILQGVFRDAAGQVCRGLVTLPVGDLGTCAEFQRMPDTPPECLTIEPGDRPKALRAAALTVELCARLGGQRPCGGRLTLRGEVPVGLGMGSSTSDILAAVRAVSASFGVELPAQDVARLAVRAERACDPLMLEDRPLLFAQRQGRVLEVLGGALPRTVVLGCTTGGGRPVDTLALPAVEYGERELETFEGLRTALRRAIGSSDAGLLGRVCTESARSNQRVLAKDEFPVLEAVARATGALGVQVAHSGNVAGLLFDPHARDLHRRLTRCARALRAEGIPVTRIFQPGAARGSPHVARRGFRPARGRARIRRPV